MYMLARRFTYLALLFLSSLSPLSQAVIVEGNFKASIYWQEQFNSSHQNLEPFWSENLIGQIISGTFWYEAGKPTTPPPPSHEPLWNVASYTVPAINITAQIGENKFSIDKDVAYEYNNIFMQYFDPIYEEWEIYDLYDIYQSVDTIDGQSRSAQIWLTNGFHDLLNYTQLIQNFSIEGEFLGELDIEVAAYANNQTLYSNHLFANIFEFNVGVRKSDIPEPVSINILALALIILGFLRRNKKWPAHIKIGSSPARHLRQHISLRLRKRL